MPRTSYALKTFGSSTALDATAPRGRDPQVPPSPPPLASVDAGRRRAWWQDDVGDVAVVPAAVARGVLPLVHGEALVAGAVVVEERRHRARERVARDEVRVDERRG